MTLWTIQPLGFLVGNRHEDYIYLRHQVYPKDNGYPYFWMRNQMIKRIGISFNGIIWAWSQYMDSKHKRPDLRMGGHLERGSKALLIEFEMPKDQIVLSDFEAWHFPLNNWYLGSDKKFEKVVDRYRDKRYPKTIQKRIEKSWQEVFRVHRNKPQQATLWQIAVESVQGVKEFVAR
jgi:hypothetical protein